MASLEVLLGSRPPSCWSACSRCGCRCAWACPRCCSTSASASLLGESVLGIRFSDAALTESLGLAALVLILAEGGLTTRWAAVRPCAAGRDRAVDGVGAWSASASSGPRCTSLLGLDWRTAFLWGAVLSSTDAAAVFSVLRGVGVSRRLAGALELESGMNDAPVVLAVVLLASTEPITWLTPAPGGLRARRGCGRSGALLGCGGRVGAAPRRAARRPACTRSPRSPSACSAYSAGQLAHASGLLATYVAALVLGNSNLPHRGGVLSFAEGTGWLAQIGLFVLLGLYASPPRLVDAVVPALIAGAVLLLAARPLSVIAAAAAVPGAVARAGVPVVVGAARRGADRARPHRAHEGAPSAHRPRRRRVRAGRGAHPAAGHDAAVGRPAARGRAGGRAAGDRGRRRPARRAGRRPAAGPRARRLPAARGLPARAAAAARRDGEPGRARRRGVHPDGRDPAARARPAARRHHGRACGRRPRTRIRAVDHARSAGALARRGPAESNGHDGRCE